MDSYIIKNGGSLDQKEAAYLNSDFAKCVKGAVFVTTRLKLQSALRASESIFFWMALSKWQTISLGCNTLRFD